MGCNSYKIKIVHSNNLTIDDEISTFEFSKTNLKAYQDSLNKEDINEVINYSNKNLNVGCPEGLLGNFICDLSMEFYKKTNYSSPTADICILNNGGLRAPISKGPVTRANIFELMPFENYLVVVELDSNKMQSLLDFILKKSNECISRKSGVPVSGIRISIEKSNIKRCMINNREIEKNKTYYVLTTDYLASGGDNMTFFKECKQHTTGLLLRNVISDYIENIGHNNIKIDAQLDGRIEFN